MSAVLAEKTRFEPFFREAGTSHDDLVRRDGADPFPNRYAPPPPAYRGY